MKFIRYFALLVAVAWGCSDDPDPQEDPRIEEIENIVTNGKWRISYFFETDEDETAKYEDFAFQFLPSGSLVANDGPDAVSGTWSVEDQGSSDDNSDDIDFNISFSTSPLLNELSDDWEIISVTGSRIDLRHVSGGNGGTDLLTFERI